MTLKEHLKLFWRLKNDKKIPDAKFIRWISNYFRDGAAAKKISEKINLVSDSFPESKSVTTCCEENYRKPFSAKKKKKPMDRQNTEGSISYWITIIWTKPGPEPYLWNQAQPCAILDASVHSTVARKGLKPGTQWLEEKKHFVPAVDRTPVFQSVVRHYINWATRHPITSTRHKTRYFICWTNHPH